MHGISFMRRDRRSLEMLRIQEQFQKLALHTDIIKLVTLDNERIQTNLMNSGLVSTIGNPQAILENFQIFEISDGFVFDAGFDDGMHLRIPSSIKVYRKGVAIMSLDQKWAIVKGKCRKIEKMRKIKGLPPPPPARI